ncbi:MAG: glycoside hydrolase [Deltaproteobacteria bacterium]|nr:MAG: glycoside hydrolase [Deltaproteobacteria bacterium]
MKVSLCFLWHMHQPHYKDPETGTYILPWVRLHAIKDYVALPRIFRRFPSVRHTFNLVPSLLVQLQDYVENGAEDIYLSLSRKNALDLTRDEEEFLLKNFFSAFPPTMILPQPRYAELFMGQDAARRAIGKPGGAGGFGASEYTDLMTLFNLTWFHPMLRDGDDELARLWRKGRGYTEREKAYVLDRQIEIMSEVIPEYRRLMEKDGGELSSTPMNHPILPLLIDTRSAQDAHPGAVLPKVPFAYPEDALEQLVRGRDTFRSLFGSYPSGLWPSEGSISPATMELAARAGFKWAATDEVLLSKALKKPVLRDAEGAPLEPDWLYTPYRADTPSGPVHLFFRDHHLSDLIGFEYSRWDAIGAVNNFIHNISVIYDKLSSLPSSQRKESYTIPVILDGENAWEYYYDSGRLFLQTLMERLGKLSPEISCKTLSEALHDADKNANTLTDIPSGSWIDGTFHIWIGHEEDRSAWVMLARARALWQLRFDQALKSGKALRPSMERAKEYLLVAEGSDWCWWYGDDHFTPHGPEFDRLFRHYIKAAYREMGETTPDSLDIPILHRDRIPAGANVLAAPRTYLNPRINGSISSYFEWSAATKYIPNPGFGTMHRAGHGILSCLYYGFDETRILLRIDFVPMVFETDTSLEVEFLFPGKDRKISLVIGTKRLTLAFTEGPIGETPEESIPVARPETIVAAFQKVLELGIPFRELRCENDTHIEFFMTVSAQGMIGERWPMYGTFAAELPGEDFIERMWEV